jgi:predicted O-linked N-acetylglucosamine transferase (SPINDLY family)
VGLPEQGFVFACFNANNKITPAMFAVWMRLLARAPGSVLWLLDHGEAVCANLRREAEAVGVDGRRLVFAPRLGITEHIDRLQLADLFLDTLPYNAHTTGSDALWAGVPLVTCPGRSFQARVAGSLLQAIDLPELIASSLADYEAIAVKLANDRDAHAAIRAKLMANRLTTPLFDTERFARALETAYEAMWRRWCVGQPPEAIEIPAGQPAA